MNPKPTNDLGDYAEFLQCFQKADYDFIGFKELGREAGKLILRHDIDFDTSRAHECAVIERQLGIKAAYFFLLRSKFYNLYAPEDFENVRKIQELGHTISVHFDPVLYEDFQAGLRKEVSLFMQLFDTPVQIISLHRPNNFFKNLDEPIFGIEHTYQRKYFKDIKYFSDSTGAWRYGHPLESEAFARRKSLHVLSHPVWWMTHAATNKDKLRGYFGRRVNELKKEFSANCTPFREIYEQL